VAGRFLSWLESMADVTECHRHCRHGLFSLKVEKQPRKPAVE
jgi:hypothetical protein